MSRSPAVANRFYPGNKRQLEALLNDFVPPSASRASKKVLGVMSPHAGFIYSGKVAANTIAKAIVPPTVVLLGPNHQGYGASISLSNEKWEMATGDVPINTPLATLLQKECSKIEVDEIAHRFEHSLEVQIPFLHHMQKKLSIVPLVLAHISFSECVELGKALAKSIETYGDDVLIVASTDMNHYESRDVASKKDNLAITQIEDFNPEGLYRTVHEQQISMCGVIPVTVMLETCKRLGAQTTEITEYTDSGVVSGDVDQVVGYCGALVY